MNFHVRKAKACLKRVCHYSCKQVKIYLATTHSKQTEKYFKWLYFSMEKKHSGQEWRICCVPRAKIYTFWTMCKADVKHCCSVLIAFYSLPMTTHSIKTKLKQNPNTTQGNWSLMFKRQIKTKMKQQEKKNLKNAQSTTILSPLVLEKYVENFNNAKSPWKQNLEARKKSQKINHLLSNTLTSICWMISYFIVLHYFPNNCSALLHVIQMLSTK